MKKNKTMLMDIKIYHEGQDIIIDSKGPKTDEAAIDYFDNKKIVLKQLLELCVHMIGSNGWEED